jgi:GNAT superfamily N-acetyltransferase
MDISLEALAHHPALISLVARWHFEEWGHADPGGSEASWAQQLSARAQVAGVPSYYVAFVDSMPAGSVGLCENDMSAHPELTPWLSGLYVLPRFRLRGIGGFLVLRAMEEARAAGVRTLFLHTADAVDLYARHGWHRIAREFYEGAEVSIMSTELAGSQLGEPEMMGATVR